MSDPACRYCRVQPRESHTGTFQHSQLQFGVLRYLILALERMTCRFTKSEYDARRCSAYTRLFIVSYTVNAFSRGVRLSIELSLLSVSDGGRHMDTQAGTGTPARTRCPHAHASSHWASSRRRRCAFPNPKRRSASVSLDDVLSGRRLPWMGGRPPRARMVVPALPLAGMPSHGCRLPLGCMTSSLASQRNVGPCFPIRAYNTTQDCNVDIIVVVFFLFLCCARH